MTSPSQSNLKLTAEQLAACAPIEQYFLGHANDDASHMRQAFLPSAHIESMREGVFTSWPLDVYCERFGGKPAADEATRRRSIERSRDVGPRCYYLYRLLRAAANPRRMEDREQSLCWPTHEGIKLPEAQTTYNRRLLVIARFGLDFLIREH
jgi:hypothetical protein